MHRGPELRREMCQLCGGREVEATVFACDLFQECTIRSYGLRVDGAASARLPVCISCDRRYEPDPDARHVIIHNGQSPGDICVLTAAVRALHDAYPRKFVTAIDSPCPELWEFNKFSAHKIAADAQRVDATYSQVNSCNDRPVHFFQAMCDDLADSLQIARFSGDWRKPSILLSDAELVAPQQVAGRYWLVNSGIKRDFTAKRWNGFQEVVTRTRHRVNWVQVGSLEHDHRPLDGAVNLLGQTNLRELVRAVYHAEGVLCGVTALMHLAQWVDAPRKNTMPRRHGVVIGGGREPPSWFAYPGHHVFHTIGELSCCADGGCWKSRVTALNDGDEQDRNLCTNPSGDQGRCMALIDPELVSRLILRLAG